MNTDSFCVRWRNCCLDVCWEGKKLRERRSPHQPHNRITGDSRQPLNLHMQRRRSGRHKGNPWQCHDTFNYNNEVRGAHLATVDRAQQQGREDPCNLFVTDGSARKVSRTIKMGTNSNRLCMWSNSDRGCHKNNEQHGRDAGGRLKRSTS